MLQFIGIISVCILVGGIFLGILIGFTALNISAYRNAYELFDVCLCVIGSIAICLLGLALIGGADYVIHKIF